MRFDPWQLGYTRHSATLAVHYPKRDATGETVYGAGFAFDPRPEIARSPDSARATLWRAMLEEDA
jgi:hypothetical protein